jgi:L-xylulokinase
MNIVKGSKIQSPYLLGIDIGLTNIKAVLFTLDGQPVGSGSVLGNNHSPKPHWVERDMNLVWQWVCQAIKQAIDSSHVSPKDIKAVGVTAHGDGAFLLDKNNQPVRPAILSLDSRSADVMNEWKASGVLQRSVEISGQQPFVGSSTPILAWLKKNEKKNYDNIGSILYCKDWIRFKLTNEIFTDFTEASSTLTNGRTQKYEDAILKNFGLEEMIEKLPQVKMPYEFAGKVTREAAGDCGLAEGTAVCTGLHDMDAVALGMGCMNPGQVAIISGTWGINGVITSEYSNNPTSLSRNFIKPGLWFNIVASPASASNLEWMVENLCQEECKNAKKEHRSKFEFVNKEVEEVLNEESQVFFIPFLYGSPYGDKPSSCFIGIKGWHRRAHLLKAIYEGVVFNHMYELNLLKGCCDFTDVRLSGGGARSQIWSQMFSDGFNMPISVQDVSETGALGVSLCAATAAGIFNSIDEAVAETVKIHRVHTPNPERHAILEKSFVIYNEMVNALLPIWNKYG